MAEKEVKRFEELRKKGGELISKIENGVLNSLSDKVILLDVLSTPANSIKRNRKEGEEEEITYRPVGVVLEFKIDYDKVPSLPIELNEETGFTAKDVKYSEVKAGEKVQLTMYELMMLIVKPEFGGSIYTHDGVRVNFAPNPTKFNKGKAKLPTPAISLEGKKLNDYYIMIADVGENSTVETLKEGYDDKFKHFLKKKRQPAERKFTNATKVSLALFDTLYEEN